MPYCFRRNRYWQMPEIIFLRQLRKLLQSLHWINPVICSTYLVTALLGRTWIGTKLIFKVTFNCKWEYVVLYMRKYFYLRHILVRVLKQIINWFIPINEQTQLIIILKACLNILINLDPSLDNSIKYNWFTRVKSLLSPIESISCNQISTSIINSQP